MRSLPTPLDASIAAFREVTSEVFDGRVTRARVLAAAGRRAHRRLLVRRTAVVLGVTLLVVTSGSAAWTAIARWRSASAITDTGRRPQVVPAARTLPSESSPQPSSAPAGSPASEPGEGEHGAYALAHHAHFIKDAPAVALRAWNHYLQRYPRGAFAPEARYNRAMCLVRLGRLVEAGQALQPFASGAMAGYRRKEATLMLQWIAERDRDPVGRGIR